MSPATNGRMSASSKQASILCGLLMGLAVLPAHAQEKTYADEYQNRIKSAGAIHALGDASFGESVDLYTGATSFHQVDIALEGTGPAIRIARRSISGDWSAVSPMAYSGFGDWQLEVPEIRTLVPGTLNFGSTVGDWRTYDGNGQTTLQRCTHMGKGMWSPPAGYLGVRSGAVDSSMWWQGYQLDVGGPQQILLRGAGAPSPATGSYPGVTTSHWQIGCLPATTNGQAGEAFLALAPDGTKYHFTHLTYDQYNEFRDTDPAMPGYFSIQPRNIARMKVTRIEDRFGNYVTYGYSGDKLTSIAASDGRSLSIAWWPDAPLIKSVTAQGRVWNYDYASRSAAGGTLAKVTAPDNSAWVFNGTAAAAAIQPVTMYTCIDSLTGQATVYPTSAAGISSTYTLTSPSGAVGVFQYSSRLRAQSYMPTYCVSQPVGAAASETANPFFLVDSLVNRQVSGPGISTATWSYAYEPAKPSADRDCAGNICQGTTYTDVVEPDGTRTRYIHSTRHAALHGKLLRVESYESGTTLKRSEDKTYNYAEGDRPYPGTFGSSNFTTSPSYGAENLVLVRKQAINQQNRNFIWEVPAGCVGGLTGYCFDVYGRPTKVTKSSSP